jgi:hypothetical protein
MGHVYNSLERFQMEARIPQRMNDEFNKNGALHIHTYFLLPPNTGQQNLSHAYKSDNGNKKQPTGFEIDLCSKESHTPVRVRQKIEYLN